MNETDSNGARESAYLAAFSTLLFSAAHKDAPDPQPVERALRYVSQLGEDELTAFFRLADVHHITVRGLAVLKSTAVAYGLDELVGRLQLRLTAEHKRITNALEYLDAIRRALGA